MPKINWKVGMVPCLGPNNLRNSHTIGMMDLYNHLEFQCVLPLQKELVMYALNGLGIRVMNGETFTEGQIVPDLFESPSVRLDKAIEGGRIVLRVIFPDPELRWPEDPQCAEPYKHQTMRVFEDDNDYPCHNGNCNSPCDTIRH